MPDTFALLDHDGSGTLESEDFSGLALHLLEGVAEPLTSARSAAVLDGAAQLWEALQRQADTDGDGFISREEFSTAISAGRLHTAEVDRSLRHAIRAVLDLCDQDGNGELDADELGVLLVRAGLPVGQVARVFAELDSDGSGTVSLEELVAAAYRMLTG